jgi:hypothetical protein
VDADPHAHIDALQPPPRRERPLRADRRGDRVARAGEGDEERVVLGVDLAAVVLDERRAQQALILANDIGPAVAQPRQQPRRALDVAEQERHGPARKLRHKPQPRPITTACQEVPPAELSQRRSRIEQEHWSTVNRCARSLLVPEEGNDLPRPELRAAHDRLGRAASAPGAEARTTANAEEGGREAGGRSDVSCRPLRARGNRRRVLVLILALREWAPWGSVAPGSAGVGGATQPTASVRSADGIS